MTSTTAMLIEVLQNPELYDHEVTGFELIETHISWVLLTGPYAYKIKKPIDFDFVDFSTLAQRRRYCEEELRLNRRLAPELYRRVATITGSPQQPKLNGFGAVIEYAVQMQQFDQAQLLSHLAARDELTAAHIDNVADTVAAFHRRISTAPVDSVFGRPEQVSHWAEQNFSQMLPLLLETRHRNRLETLREWTQATEKKHRAWFEKRKAEDYIRECHGDLHLGNITLIDDYPVIFDCIEFNQELRWIDVMSEVAFTVMDLHDRQQPALANRFLDRYMSHTGDYAGLTGLPYYLVYRALVRAKIDLLRLTQTDLTESERQTVLGDYQGYADLAQRLASERHPVLYLTHGLAGAGKSTLAAQLVMEYGTVRLRSDVERKRLYGLTQDADSGSPPTGGIYTEEATRETYRYLAKLARQVISAGFPVVVDATFLCRWQRELFFQLARELNIPCLIIDLKAPLEVLQERLRQRQKVGTDPSEATLDVLTLQQRNHEPLSAAEKAYSVTIDATAFPKSLRMVLAGSVPDSGVPDSGVPD